MMMFYFILLIQIIHKSPTTLDSNQRLNFRQTVPFQSTRVLWLSTDMLSKAAQISGFQSTRVLRLSTEERELTDTVNEISIHESPATLDSLFINLRLLYIVFQSTRVLRLSTMRVANSDIAQDNFNPRESCDSRRLGEGVYPKIANFNPRESCDSRQKD